MSGTKLKLTPHRGMLFLHRRVLDEHEQPLAYRVTALRQGMVYYRPVHGGGSDCCKYDEFDRWAMLAPVQVHFGTPLHRTLARLAQVARVLGRQPGERMDDDRPVLVVGHGTEVATLTVGDCREALASLVSAHPEWMKAS